MKIIKKTLLLLLIVLIVAQFFSPDKNEGDLASIDAFLIDTNPPEDVRLILDASCYDCHTDVTRYPWYNSITPVNYWLADHVKHGKKHFNLSNWEGNSIKKKDHKFDELIEMVSEEEMPLPSYTWTHGDANLTDEQRQSIIKWAEQVRFKYSLAPKPE